MRSLCQALFALLILSTNSVPAQTHLADGTQVIRGNRLMSVRSAAGSQLCRLARPSRPIEITVDGTMGEPQWASAQVVAPFLDPHGKKTETSVRLLYDQENIYLFWTVEQPDGITATLKQHDGILTTDDYVQIQLRPWLPANIKVARDYAYTVAVNPHGTVWDAYLDPYLGGYFFSSWDSKARVVTQVGKNGWTAEMTLPFANLDNLSDAGWQWGVALAHSSLQGDGSRTICVPPMEFLVRQGVTVRRQNLVDYYWTRPEFLREVKPAKPNASPPEVPLAALKSLPRNNGRMDQSLWENVPPIQIGYSDRSGRELRAKTARARIGYQGNHLALALEADGAKTQPRRQDAAKLGQGMEGQTASLNGVFVDQGLFVDECFWILVQPRDPARDRVHQACYLILVTNRGEVRGTRYDRFGTPDRSWLPQVQVDLYDTADGWGAELNIALNSFDLPMENASTWGLNLFRNRLLDRKAGPRSELQAWIPTGTDFLNPDTFGLLKGMVQPSADIVRPGFQRHMARLQHQVAALARQRPELGARLSTELAAVGLTGDEQLRAARSRLQQVDHQLGVAQALDRDRTTAALATGGYAILDLQLNGSHGCAVGAMGTVLTTHDGGRNWQPVPPPSDADLQRVFFVSPSEGWAAGGRVRMGATNEAMRHDERGGYGTIFHTLDGGRTWECQYANRGRHLFGLHFVDEHTGFACGELGLLLKTTDGGETWKELSTTGTSRWLYGIAFLDRRHGFAVGESECVIETTDGGTTWTARSLPADRQFYGFRPFYRDVVFRGPTGCIVGQNGAILISRDRGRTWQHAATFIDPQLRELLDFTRVTFPTSELGYAVSELGTRIMVTEDAGRSWSLKPVANSDWLRAVWADADGQVCVAGEGEKILRSTNRGRTWRTSRGDRAKADVLVMLAHGDDAAIELGAFYAHYGLEKGKRIVDVEVLRDAHSVEYRGEIYNLEHHRAVRMAGVRTTTYFDEFENGNNGCDYYHFTQRLWRDERNVVRHMVAVIRAYRPDVMIIHDGVFGDYDKPGHKL